MCCIFLNAKRVLRCIKYKQAIRIIFVFDLLFFVTNIIQTVGTTINYLYDSTALTEIALVNSMGFSGTVDAQTIIDINSSFKGAFALVPLLVVILAIFPAIAAYINMQADKKDVHRRRIYFRTRLVTLPLWIVI